METILVVDDEPALLELCRVILESDGYKVLSASNGEQALHVVEEHSGEIALAVLDQVMPGMNGSELGQRIQRINPDIPIVLMTGSSPKDVSRMLGGSTYRIIWKPFETESLSKAVVEVIDTSTVDK